MAASKELKSLIRDATAQGWTIDRSRAGHLKWRSPQGGMPYFSSSTPSDKRAIHNIETALRRMGLSH